MKRKSPRLILIFAASALIPLLVNGQTNTIIVPKEAEANPGDSYEAPFAYAYQGYAEQVYGPSEFSSLPIDIITITEVAFRVDESYDGELDAVLPSIELGLNTFQGSMADVVCRGSGALNQAITYVFGGSNFPISGRPGSFDVRFPLQIPFVYDRRLGPLVLSFPFHYYAKSRYDMDAQGVGGTWHFNECRISPLFVPDRGAYITLDSSPMQDPHSNVIEPIVLVTRFTYSTPIVEINTIRVSDGIVQIDFSLLGSPTSIRTEGSTNVAGPYSAEESAQVITNSESKLQATIPIATSNRFFRIRLQ